MNLGNLNLEGLDTHLALSKVVMDKFAEHAAIDVIAYLRGAMAHDLAREIERRMFLTCRRLPDKAVELRADLWVFRRDELDQFVAWVRALPPEVSRPVIPLPEVPSPVTSL